MEKLFVFVYSFELSQDIFLFFEKKNKTQPNPFIAIVLSSIL